MNAQDWKTPSFKKNSWNTDIPSELDKQKRNILLISEASAYTIALVGLNQLNVTVSCDCNDTNQTNNMYTLNLTTVIYSLSTTLDTDIVTVNQSRLITKLFLV